MISHFFIAFFLARSLAPPLLTPSATQPAHTLRVATFNIFELTAEKLDRVEATGTGPNASERGLDVQLCKAAEIIQRVRPDILQINEIDFGQGKAAKLFLNRYLRIGQAGQQEIDYPYLFTAPVNTGEPTGMDLDHNGRTDGPGDAYGFGNYPGQYGLALYGRYPIATDRVRTFRNFLWKDMPGNLMPDGQANKPAWYTPEQSAILRLSSKNHWDVPVQVGRVYLHILASHPTPPVFDGREDRNGRRNFDEIRLWKDYLAGGSTANYLIDDAGRRGGLQAGALFVLLGDLNADPVLDSDTYGQVPIEKLLQHARIQDLAPSSPGAAAYPAKYHGDKSKRTAEFGRVDYILPDRTLKVRASGVFWPGQNDPLSRLVTAPSPASDHHLVWVDLELPGNHP